MPGSIWTQKETEKLIQERNKSNGDDVAFSRRYRCNRTVHAIRAKVKYLRDGGLINKRVIETPTPNILFFDIETLPIICYTWGIWEQNVLLENIIKDWCVLSWSANWEGDERIFGDILAPKEAMARNDERLLGGMWKLLDRADIVVSQNGKRFDHKKLNARFIHYKNTPPAPYRIIDTLAVAKSVAGFTSNKLDWLAQETGVETRKSETGMELWRKCDAGDSESLAKMLEYNLGDVLELKQVYTELRPWIVNHPNINMYMDVPSNACPVCGGGLVDIGRYPTQNRKARSVRCCDCGWVGRVYAVKLEA
ncbi:MAG: ribonuclease H-like domain-containing protein [Candidatus Obscuribacterales bacterium]|jgi:DNA polymerase III epsilon subunit-like protein